MSLFPRVSAVDHLDDDDLSFINPCRVLRADPAALMPEQSVAVSSSRRPLHATLPTLFWKRQLHRRYVEPSRPLSVLEIGPVFDRKTVDFLADLLPSWTGDCLVVTDGLDPATGSFIAFDHAAAATTTAALRTLILPHTAVLCTSVDTARALLADAGVAVPEPRGIPDIQLLGIALRQLGPQYVIIGQETAYDAGDTTSWLQYVLCGPESAPEHGRIDTTRPNHHLGVLNLIILYIAIEMTNGRCISKAIPEAFSVIMAGSSESYFYALENK